MQVQIDLGGREGADEGAVLSGVQKAVHLFLRMAAVPRPINNFVTNEHV
jgi:hypothetical protein